MGPCAASALRASWRWTLRVWPWGASPWGRRPRRWRPSWRTLSPRCPRANLATSWGVGTPPNILRAVGVGIDLFDCVLPTRSGRHGRLFTAFGPLNIKNARFKDDGARPDPTCSCRVCQRFSRSYLRHLFMVGEEEGPGAASYHNLHFYLRLMESAARAIEEDRFRSFRLNFEAHYNEGRWAS